MQEEWEGEKEKQFFPALPSTIIIHLSAVGHMKKVSVNSRIVKKRRETNYEIRTRMAKP